LNHLAREAVARCPECRFFFCRECIAEHDDRVICATCLKKIVKASAAKRSPVHLLKRLTFGAFGLVTAWLFFYWVGQGLLSIPTEFHDGKIWRTGFWNE
ncbi:MAG: rhomboid family protein, partial [Verrucomicrobiota bacterium]